MKLEILRSCPTCESLFYDRISQALKIAGLREKVQIEHIKDPQYFVNMGVFMTPALVLNGEVISEGELLLPDKVIMLLRAKGVG